MKKVFLIGVCVILSLFVSCRESVPLVPESSAASMISFLQSSEFSSILSDNKTGSGVEVKNEVVGGQLQKEISFKEYESSYGVKITSGSMLIKLYSDGNQSAASVNLLQTKDTISINEYSLEIISPIECIINNQNYTFNITISRTSFISPVTAVINTDASTFEVEGNLKISVSSSNSSIITDDGYIVNVDDVGNLITEGFGGGNGTQTDPYKIYNADQFANIVDLSKDMAENASCYFYFEVFDDIEFYDGMKSPAIPLFRGEIDFNGHSLRGISYSILNSNTTAEQDFLNESTDYAWMGDEYSCLIGCFINGAIRNLEYYPEEFLPISVYGNYISPAMEGAANPSIIFESVNTYGFFDDLGGYPNASLYIAQVFNANLKFEKCTNNASFTTLNYGAAFVGGYADRCHVEISNCVNNGNITGGQYAAVMFGNNVNFSQPTTHPVGTTKVENCENNGKIICTGTNVGYFYPLTTSSTDEEAVLNQASSGFDMSTYDSNSGNDKDHIILCPEISDIYVSEGSDGEILLSTGNSEYASISVSGGTYAQDLDENGSVVGTLYVSVDSNKLETTVNSEIHTGIKRLQMVDRLYPSINSNEIWQDEYGNSLIKINGNDYYYYEGYSETDDIYIVGATSNYISTLTFYVYAYDSDGNLIGRMVI